jgi:hypothetical protein
MVSYFSFDTDLYVVVLPNTLYYSGIFYVLAVVLLMIEVFWDGNMVTLGT